jgi:iron(III) transport system ATP-binding protein
LSRKEASAEPTAEQGGVVRDHWGRRGTAAATIAAGLTFENVQRRYGTRLALAGVSLDVAPGEIVCMLGPSGCGKTTLLRIAAGIEKPSAGRVLVNGLEVAGPQQFVPPERRNVGLMFQDFALFPHLSILQNVAFGLWSLSRPEARHIAMTALDRVGLSRLAEAFPHTLSGGEQQRVALARAIAPRPGVLLMDEPFSGLDVMLRQSMQEETLALLRETRATSIIVTHDPEEAMRLADRIVVMHEGRILQAGSAEALYSAPASLFVARLFSDINEVPATVCNGQLDTVLGRLPAEKLPDGSKAILCVRQRAVELLEAGQGLAARVLDVKFLGDAAVVELAVAGLDDTLLARSQGRAKLARGQEVGVRVDPATLLGFPAGREK